MLIAFAIVAGLACTVGLLTVAVMYNSRAFGYQIRADSEKAIAELEAAFIVASEIIAATPSAPQQQAAQSILDRLATNNIRQAKEYLARPDWAYLAKSEARTGMRNVEGAVRFLAHDTTGKFIGIPGEVSPAVRKLLEDSMHPHSCAD
jgi:hypothetical protein